MKVSELMSVGVQTVSPGTPAANARERMRTKQIHHLLVKEKDAIVGVLSARDLARAGRRGVVKPRLVSEFMTPRVVTIAPTASVHKAANSMRGHSIGCLIVVEEGKAVGILTLSDLLDRVAEPPRHRSDGHTPPDLNFQVPHRKQHRTGGAW